MAQYSMRDLAREADVSQSTVSRALRNDPSISEATRRRIQALAAKRQYRFDPRITELMTSLRKGVQAPGQVIAWLDLQKQRDYWDVERHSQPIWEGAARHAKQLGFQLERFRIADFPDSSRRLNSVLRARGIRAVILSGRCPSGLALDLDWEFYASVKFGFVPVSPGCDVVEDDGLGLVARCLKEIATRGYRRIGFPFVRFAQRHDPHLAGEHAGAIAEFQASPESQDAKVSFTQLDWNRTSFEAFAKWFREYRPDAILVNCRQALDWLRTLGEEPGKTVGVAHLYTDFQELDDHWSGGVVHCRQIGETLVEQVTARFTQHAFGLPETPRMILITPGWQDGATLPQRRL